MNFTATNSFYSNMVTGTAGPQEYRLALAPVPDQAFAQAQIAAGTVNSASITSPGSGYDTVPSVNIFGGGGSNAMAVATVSGGSVTGVTITSPGSGYTNAPTIRIGQPPAIAVSPVVFPVLRLDFSAQAGQTYHIQFTPSLDESWTDLEPGGINPAQTGTYSQYLILTTPSGFYRIAEP